MVILERRVAFALHRRFYCDSALERRDIERKIKREREKEDQEDEEVKGFEG